MDVPFSGERFDDDLSKISEKSLGPEPPLKPRAISPQLQGLNLEIQEASEYADYFRKSPHSICKDFGGEKVFLERQLGLDDTQSKIESREMAVKSKEEDAETRLKAVEKREMAVQRKEEGLERRLKAVEMWEMAVQSKEQDLESRLKAVEKKEMAVQSKEEGSETRLKAVEKREMAVQIKEEDFETRLKALEKSERDHQEAMIRERKALEEQREAIAKLAQGQFDDQQGRESLNKETVLSGPETDQMETGSTSKSEKSESVDKSELEKGVGTSAGPGSNTDPLRLEPATDEQFEQGEVETGSAAAAAGDSSSATRRHCPNPEEARIDLESHEEFPAMTGRR